MENLLDCLDDWLKKNRADGSAYSLLVALARETHKRRGSADPAQLEFDAEQLYVAAGGESGFQAAKTYVARSGLERFVEVRRASLEDHFRSAGHDHALQLKRRSPGGKHRAVWYLERYRIDALGADDQAGAVDPVSPPEVNTDSIDYDYTPPGGVRPAWYARPLVGSGSFAVMSGRSLVWLALLLIPVSVLAIGIMYLLGLSQLRRPLWVSDLAGLLTIGAVAWGVWRTFLRPVGWLVDDRIALATEPWVAWRERNAQLQLAKNESGRPHLQLVRYSAVCPICAGAIELRYSEGRNRRRLVGCCSEAPHDHQYTFDRISRKGSRLP